MCPSPRACGDPARPLPQPLPQLARSQQNIPHVRTQFLRLKRLLACSLRCAREARPPPRRRAPLGVKLPLGISPLTRGSPTKTPTRNRSRGSIPAHAGQPRSTDSALPGARVHPRSRGAAGPLLGVRFSDRGPSPLTRGSQVIGSNFCDIHGSIPAHAGQPPPRCRSGLIERVHPRSRGAADRPEPSQWSRMGPSPLTRGSRKPWVVWTYPDLTDTTGLSFG